MPLDELTIRYPSGFEEAVHLTKAEMEQHGCLMAARKMFELGKISSGRAAEFAGMSRPEFFEACGRYRVSAFNYRDEEVGKELCADVVAAEETPAQ